MHRCDEFHLPLRGSIGGIPKCSNVRGLGTICGVSMSGHHQILCDNDWAILRRRGIVLCVPLGSTSRQNDSMAGAGEASRRRRGAPSRRRRCVVRRTASRDGSAVRAGGPVEGEGANAPSPRGRAVVHVRTLRARGESASAGSWLQERRCSCSVDATGRSCGARRRGRLARDGDAFRRTARRSRRLMRSLQGRASELPATARRRRAGRDAAA